MSAMQRNVLPFPEAMNPDPADCAAREEIVLLARVAEGNTSALKELYDRHRALFGNNNYSSGLRPDSVLIATCGAETGAYKFLGDAAADAAREAQKWSCIFAF